MLLGSNESASGGLGPARITQDGGAKLEEIPRRPVTARISSVSIAAERGCAKCETSPAARRWVQRNHVEQPVIERNGQRGEEAT